MPVGAVDHGGAGQSTALEVHVAVDTLAAAVKGLAVVEMLKALFPLLSLLLLFDLQDLRKLLGLLASADVVLGVGFRKNVLLAIQELVLFDGVVLESRKSQHAEPVLLVLQEDPPGAFHPPLVLYEERIECILIHAATLRILFKPGPMDKAEVRILSAVPPTPTDALDHRAYPCDDRGALLVIIQKSQLFVCSLPHLLALVVVFDLLIFVIGRFYKFKEGY